MLLPAEPKAIDCSWIIEKSVEHALARIAAIADPEVKRATFHGEMESLGITDHVLMRELWAAMK